ncbi:MAG: ribose-phosphate pyrophosphokinase [Deltaproteobacteria bacterium]|nr:ribose-phosphate pyrophosphokinase [Deltaproteobacteria bacterium]
MERLKIVTGSSNTEFADSVCRHLGVPLSKSVVKRFSDGEIMVEIHESMRGMRAFVVQSTCDPVNTNLMELLIIIDALKRASAAEINAVIPYYGYARQDRKVAPRAPISAKLVADLLTVAGTDRVIAMDLHAGQIQGFFDIPVDHLYALPVLVQYVKENIEGEIAVVSPDAGGVERARAYAKRLGSSLVIIDKRRSGPNVLEEMNVIGDIEGKVAVIIDDMIDTAGTLTKAANVLMEEGALKVYGFASHGVLSGPAIDRIAQSRLSKVVVTNSIPVHDHVAQCDKIEVLSVSGLFADAIKRIYIEDSVSCLFS